MNYFHLEAKVVSRGAGRSVIAAAAYASCSRLYNDYDGLTHDYTRKQGCLYSEVFLPQYAPENWKDRQVLWEAVESVEKTKDSRLARELVVALPSELSLDDWKNMLERFIREQGTDLGIVGKSSLINALVPGTELRTGEISDIHHTGTHTTTFSEMIDLPEGGAVIDIPGVRGFGTIDFAPEEVGHFFPEIFRTSRDCRYSDCKHTGEPGCAVIPAVEEHYISESRYASYLSILEEASEEAGADKYRKPF